MAACSKRDGGGKEAELLCGPCLDDEGKRLAAEGFCVDCSDYLCQECFQSHCVPRPMKNHKLLGKRKMPKEPPKVHDYKDEDSTKVHKEKEEFTERCARHNDLLRYYCKDEKQFACTHCINLEHRTCDYGFVADMSIDITESKEYKAFKADIETLIKQADSIDIAANDNSDDAKRHADEALDRVRDLREKFNNTLDELEKHIHGKISIILAKDQKKMADISSCCKAISNKLNKLQREISDAETKNQKCKLFVETKRNVDKLLNYENELFDLNDKNNIRHSYFIPPSELSRRLIKFSLGSVLHLKHRKRSDVSNQDIDSITIVSGKIAVLCQSTETIDCQKYRNPIMNLLDTRSGQTLASNYVGVQKSWVVIMKYEGGYKPLGMTSISDGKIAVKFNRFISIYSVTDTCNIKCESTKQSTGFIDKPIAFANDTFITVTSASPPAVCLVNMDGEITKTFPTEVKGKALFNRPSSIAVHPDQTDMYVLDSGTKTITCLTFDGEMRAHYKPAHAWEPRDLVVSRDGLVYVSDGVTNNISVLSPELKEISVIHGDQHGIYNPRNMTYCGKEHKLYVVSGWRDIVMLVL